MKLVISFCNWQRQLWSPRYHSHTSHRIKKPVWAIVARLHRCCQAIQRVHWRQAYRTISVWMQITRHSLHINRNSTISQRSWININSSSSSRWICRAYKIYKSRRTIWIVSNRRQIKTRKTFWHRTPCLRSHCHRQRRPHHSHAVHLCPRSRVRPAQIPVAMRASAAVPPRWNNCTHRINRICRPTAAASALIFHRKIKHFCHPICLDEWVIAVLVLHSIMNVARQRRVTGSR